jgi:HAMP domain-containing protein
VRVGPTSPAWYRSKRLASSVWLPWVLGVVLLLGLVAASAVLGGRVDSGLVVPSAVLDGQQASADSAAQQVRRNLNAGLQDISQLAAGMALADWAANPEPYLKDFAGRHKRYRSVYLLDARHKVIASTGGNPHPETVPDRPQQPGMTNAVKIDVVPVVVQYAPVRLRDKQVVTLVTEYDLSHLRTALSEVRPGTAWVVTTAGEVVASTSGFTAFQRLDSHDLRRAAEAAHEGSGVVATGGSRSASDIVAHAPVHGDGPASGLGWGVVTSRSVDSVALPRTNARQHALLFSLVLGALTTTIFGWLLFMFLRPLRELVRQAERLASGDLSEPVEVRRYDEIGLIARSLERMRVRVIRELIQQQPAPADTDQTVPQRQVAGNVQGPVQPEGNG